MRLEPKKIQGLVALFQIADELARFPRSMGCDDDRGDKNLASLPRLDSHLGAVSVTGDLSGAPRLKYRGPRCARSVEQDAVQHVASKGAAECLAARARHRRFDARAGCKQRDPPDFRAGQCANGLSDAQSIKDLHVHGRHELAADLSAWKRAALDDGDRRVPAAPGPTRQTSRPGRRL